MNKRILLIGPFPDPISGVSLANKIVADLLNKSNQFSTIILNTSYPYFDEHVGSFSFKKMFFFFKLNIKSFKIFKADIIYMTPGQTFFGITKYTIFILLTRLLKKESIIHVHGNHLGNCYKGLHGIKKRFFYRLINSFSKGIVLSKSLRKNLTPFLQEDKIYELPNFAENYLTSDKNEKSINNNLRIVFLSNLMYEKGVTILLDALKKIEENNIFYEAKIAGNIDESLREIIEKKLNALQNTKFIGVVRGVEKKELLNWSNTFILPTFYKMEGQPISILEAMATKNVVITTNHAGIPDVITHKKNGFFVKKKDTGSLVETLINLSENLNEIEKISKDNFEYFKDNFTMDIFKNKLLNIFNE